MFQIEVYEYTPKMSDLYHHFYNNIENKTSRMNLPIENYHTSHYIEENIDNKFLKIKSISHPFVSRYFDSVKDDNNYIFISESAGDSLDEIIDTKLSENVSFGYDEVIRIIYQLLIGVNYLERKGVRLRFLDPKRILLNEDMGVKIRNYLVDVLFKPEELKFINNFKYLAPELIFYPESIHTSKAVIWSIGMITLELLINIRKFSSHQKLFFYFSSNEFLIDYIEILNKYKHTSIFLKSEKNVEYDCTDARLLLEYYINGHFINKEDLSPDFKDFLCMALQIDPEKRKDSSYFLNHKLFANFKKSIYDKIDKSKLCLIPIDRESLQNIREETKFKQASSLDNYEIFKNILKIDIVIFLKKKGALNYKPKILDIPQYFSLFSPECEDYSISSEEDNNNIVSFSTKKLERRKSIELIYESDLNEKKFNEGCLVQIGNYFINLPVDYEKDSLSFENFIKNGICDLQLLSEGFSMLSDKSSNSDQSKPSVKDNSSTCVSQSNNISVNNNNTNNPLNRSTSNSKNININSSFEKEINYYFKLKLICSSIIYHQKDLKKEDFIMEIKKMNYRIPSNFRKYAYSIILEVDLFNDVEELEISSFYENKNFINKEMSQVRKDVIRCEEYDSFFKTDEGKYHLHSLFEGLLYNKEDFFYTQGMDSIASAVIKLFYPNREMAFQIFNKLINKLLFIFYDKEHKTIKNLDFHHLIIKRLLAFIEPELYLHLDNILFFEDQFAANWILTLFSRTFKFDFLYKIWDVLIIENINIIYLFICLIFKENKTYIMSNTKETILRDLNEISDYVKIDSFISEVIKYYKIIPISFLPVTHEFNEEVINELKNNEFFKNRWWEFEDFNTDMYSVPIITLEDTIKIFGRVVFVDIRQQGEYENIRIKDSYHLSLVKNKFQETCLSMLDKINESKIVILVGSKSSTSKYSEYVNFLFMRKIKFVTILQGGIDVVYIDEASLIYKK